MSVSRRVSIPIAVANTAASIASRDRPTKRKLTIPPGCPEVLAKFRNPVAIITKNRLVTRDIDLLGELASHRAAAVNISVTSLDPNLQRVLEPRTSAPAARLEAIATL